MGKPDVLSAQEWRVIELAADGLVDKEIGAMIGVTMPTVRTYWNRIREKLGAANRTQAVCVALFGQDPPTSPASDQGSHAVHSRRASAARPREPRRQSAIQ